MKAKKKATRLSKDVQLLNLIVKWGKATAREKIMIPDGFAQAFLGLTVKQPGRPRLAVFECEAMGAILVAGSEGSMDYEEAREYLEFNTYGAYVGKTTPLYVENDSLEDDDEDAEEKALPTTQREYLKDLYKTVMAFEIKALRPALLGWAGSVPGRSGGSPVFDLEKALLVWGKRFPKMSVKKVREALLEVGKKLKDSEGDSIRPYWVLRPPKGWLKFK